MQLRLLPIFILLALFIGSHFFPAALRADITVNASLSHTSFPEDRMSQLTITVNGASRNVDISLPQIDNISLHSRGQSSQINFINGSMSSSLIHNYLVQATQPGSYTIPPITVTISGDEYTTKQLNFDVTSTGPKNNSSKNDSEARLDEVAFLKITTTGEHYPGEIVPITIQAYFNQKYRFDEISLPTLHGDGVTSPQISGNPDKGEEVVDNRSYHVLTWNSSLSGVKVGKQSLRFTLEAALLIPQQRRRQSPFDDPFFSNFLGGYQRKPISVESDEIVFSVLPLPVENKPDNFTGAIGDFTLEVTASPLSLDVGEPITLRMTIHGNGNFDRVEAPDFPENSAWKTYTPTSEFSPATDGSSESKFFEQAIVIKDPTTQEIPSLRFSYFDPKQKKYITRTSDPILIKLNQTIAQPNTQQIRAEVAKTTTPVKQQRIDRFEGLAPIQLETGSFHQTLEPVFNKGWYLLICAASILSLFVTLFIKKTRLHKANHPEIEQTRHRKQLLKEDMQKISQAAATGNRTQFLSDCRKTIQSQLGLLWGVEATAISYTDLCNRLPSESPLLDIFTQAEAAAYGAVVISDEQMQTYMTTLSTELENLI